MGLRAAGSMGRRRVCGLVAAVAACLAAGWLLTSNAVAAPLPVPTAAQPAAPGSAPAPPRYVSGELIVRFRPGAAAAERNSLNTAQGAREQRRMLVPRAFLLRLANGRDVPAAARAYEQQPERRLRAAELHRRARLDNSERLVVLSPVGAAQHRPDGERRGGHAGRRHRRARGVGRDAGQHGSDRRRRGHRHRLQPPGPGGQHLDATPASRAQGRRRTASTTTATAGSTTFAATTSSTATTTRWTTTATAPTWRARSGPSATTASA